MKSKGGGHSLQGFVHGYLGREKKTRRWPAGNAACVRGIFGEALLCFVCVCVPQAGKLPVDFAVPWGRPGCAEWFLWQGQI